MIDLLIVNYNTRALLERLLDTLHSDYEEGVWKLYISDNDSPDDSQEWLQANKHRYKIEKLFFNNNVGYAAAVNMMGSISDSEFLCAVNADTWFTTNHVKQVEQSFRQDDKIGVLGVKQLDESHRIRHGGINFTKDFGVMTHRGWSHYDPNDTMFKEKVECGTISGSIYYMRRDCWNQVASDPTFRGLFPEETGGFLPTPMYFEETFFSMAASHFGWKIVYDGTIETAGHSWHASNPVGSNVNYFDISRDIYRHACQAMGLRNEFDDHLVAQKGNG